MLETQKQNDYQIIQKAIEFLVEHSKNQPSLQETANHVGLSEFHFQRVFRRWAGVSPKQFLQYVTASTAKKLLRQKLTSLDTAMQTGLSSGSRLHDLFVTLESMTPGEYKNGGASLIINYSFKTCLFGNVLVASTQKGICNILFFDEGNDEVIQELKNLWPNAKLIEQTQAIHKQVIMFINSSISSKSKHPDSDKPYQPAKKTGTNISQKPIPHIPLHIKGTNFQLKVWEALLSIPAGNVVTYGEVAKATGKPKASRAVGTAVGSNPVAFLIPCHRVITSSGVIDAYRWGSIRKKALLGWEASNTMAEDSTN